MNRRFLIAGSLATLAGATLGLRQRLPRWRAERAFDAVVGETRGRLARSFPEAILMAPATTAFVEAFSTANLRDAASYSMDHVVGLFVTSTSVVSHVEQGVALDFDGLFAPHLSPCSNHLAAHMAPDGEFDA